jgi:hypothetical protein
MFAVQGIYNNGAVTIDEPVPVQEKYDVIVTFLKPTERPGAVFEGSAGIEIQDPDQTPAAEKLAALQKLTGIAAGNTMTLDDIKAARLARQ